MADRNPPLTQYRSVGWTPILAFVLREICIVVRHRPYQKEKDKNPPTKVGGFFYVWKPNEH